MKPTPPWLECASGGGGGRYRKKGGICSPYSPPPPSPFPYLQGRATKQEGILLLPTEVSTPQLDKTEYKDTPQDCRDIFHSYTYLYKNTCRN